MRTAASRSIFSRAGGVLLVLLAVWGTWPQALARLSGGQSPQKLRVNTMIERLEQGKIVTSPDDWTFIGMEHSDEGFRIIL